MNHDWNALYFGLDLIASGVLIALWIWVGAALFAYWHEEREDKKE
jgi:hypothetical protein